MKEIRAIKISLCTITTTLFKNYQTLIYKSFKTLKIFPLTQLEHIFDFELNSCLNFEFLLFKKDVAQKSHWKHFDTKYFENYYGSKKDVKNK